MHDHTCVCDCAMCNVHPSMQKIISLHREKSAQNPCISLVVVVVTDSPPLETLQTFDQIDFKTTIQKDKKTKRKNTKIQKYNDTKIQKYKKEN